MQRMHSIIIVLSTMITQRFIKSLARATNIGNMLGFFPFRFKYSSEESKYELIGTPSRSARLIRYLSGPLLAVMYFCYELSSLLQMGNLTTRELKLRLSTTVYQVYFLSIYTQGLLAFHSFISRSSEFCEFIRNLLQMDKVIYGTWNVTYQFLNKI